MKNKLVRNIFVVVSILTTSFLISSCQKMFRTYIPTYYNISNDTDNKLVVFYTYVPQDGGHEYDTIIGIETGQTRTLFVQLNSNYKLSNLETGDTLELISQIKIFNNDSIESQKNYRLTKYWKLKEYSSKSDFDLNINSEDF